MVMLSRFLGCRRGSVVRMRMACVRVWLINSFPQYSLYRGGTWPSDPPTLLQRACAFHAFLHFTHYRFLKVQLQHHTCMSSYRCHNFAENFIGGNGLSLTRPVFCYTTRKACTSGACVVPIGGTPLSVLCHGFP